MLYLRGYIVYIDILKIMKEDYFHEMIPNQ